MFTTEANIFLHIVQTAFEACINWDVFVRGMQSGLKSMSTCFALYTFFFFFLDIGLSYVTWILIGKMCASGGETVGQHERNSASSVEEKCSATLLEISDTWKAEKRELLIFYSFCEYIYSQWFLVVHLVLCLERLYLLSRCICIFGDLIFISMWCYFIC